MTEETQFKLRVAVEMVRRLERAARLYDRRSAQQVAEEVINTYLGFWEDVEKIKRQFVESQRTIVDKDSGEGVLTSPRRTTPNPVGSKLKKIRAEYINPPAETHHSKEAEQTEDAPARKNGSDG